MMTCSGRGGGRRRGRLGELGRGRGEGRGGWGGDELGETSGGEGGRGGASIWLKELAGEGRASERALGGG